MKQMKSLLFLALILVIAAGTVFASGLGETQSQGTVTAYNLPRNQTLYYNGLQWGAPRGLNPYGANSNHALAIADHRQLVYETLGLYNMLDGKVYPGLADSMTLNGNTMTIQLNQNIKFSNGAAMTAADVVYSFNLSKTYAVGQSGVWDTLDTVTAQGNYTIIITAKTPINVGNLWNIVASYRITAQAYWESKLAAGDLGRGSGDLAAFAGWDCYGSGAYMHYYADDTKVVLIRNDNYWGAQPNGRYGKLPAPKYIAQNQYRDNAAGDEAMRRGEVDVGQQFTAQIWTYFPQGVSTYLPQAPYYIPAQVPSIYFNTAKAGLDDKAVRKALAMVINYDMIGTNAMSGYTPPKEAHFMLPTDAEKSLIDEAALRQYQWTNGDVAGANALLDQAGWVRGSDGIRAKGGVRLEFRLECPYGWSDWNASLEIVAQAGAQLGMNLTTYFPEQPVWTDDMQTGNFDILMNNAGGLGANQPWARARNVMASSYLPAGNALNTQGNWGRWVNARADAIVTQLAGDPNNKALWTELNQIYLDEMPAIGLMYRPALFHQVSNNVWTNFPSITDSTNPKVPPQILCDGYGYMGMFNIRLAR